MDTTSSADLRAMRRTAISWGGWSCRRDGDPDRDVMVGGGIKVLMAATLILIGLIFAY
jgi:hypothetical protein